MENNYPFLDSDNRNDAEISGAAPAQNDALGDAPAVDQVEASRNAAPANADYNNAAPEASQQSEYRGAAFGSQSAYQNHYNNPYAGSYGQQQRPMAWSYDSNGFTQNYAAAQPAKKAKKRNSGLGWRVTAIAVVCALLGGLGGGAISASIFSTKLEDSRPAITESGSNAEKDEPPVEEIDNVTESSMQQLASDLVTNVGDKSLNPSQVYSAYVGSIVAIANEGTTTNYFGQVSATASSGSGFIITEDGYIVTNYHVIENANKLTVTLNNEEQYEAKVIGYESGNDVALIKIDAKGLKPVSIGNSDELLVGETVCAIGNPLGELTNTLTIGGISALDRVVNTDGKPINMLQTDCAINSGNSGGPLFDMNGNVIGITTAKYYGGTIEGLGFAIPINDAMKIVADLKAYGYVKGQPYMGVTVIDMDSTTAYLYNLPVGAYINTVEEGACADKAGLQPKDIVTAIGEYEVRNTTEMIASLKNFAAGDTTTLSVFRSGEELTLTITFDEKKPAEIAETTREERDAGTEGAEKQPNEEKAD